MKWIQSAGLICVGVLAFALPASPSYAATMKECAAQWDAMKAAKQTEGKKYKDFSKECMSGTAAAPAATPAAAPAAAPAPAPAAKTEKPAAEKTAAKPDAKAKTPAQEAEIARERACGADWKADKAANKIPAGMKWPQYWSDCNKRKKAAGM